MRSQNLLLPSALSFCLLFCTALPRLEAQWTALRSNTSADLHAVYFLDDNYGVAVGDTSTVLLTTDGGSNWLPVASGFKENFRSALVLGRDTLLIAGGNFFEGSVYRTTNAGFDWDFAGAGIDLALTPDWIFALDDETIYKSPNGGVNWKPSIIIIGSTMVLDQLYFPTDSVGYALGNIGGFATNSAFGFRSDDAGDHWFPLSVEMDMPNANAFTAAAFPHPDTVYLFTNQQDRFLPGPVNQLVRLTDFFFDDSNFLNRWRFTAEIVNEAMPAYINDAAFLNTEIGYAAGDDGNIYKTTNGGADWQVDYEGDVPVRGLFFTGSGTAFAAGADGLLLRLSGATPVDVAEAPAAVRVYPNPACGSLTVETAEPTAAVRLFDGMGRLVRQAELRGTNELSLRGLPKGMYVLEWRGRKGVARERVVVENSCD
jgi:photosystem II stability/assembly factor-like uncharacterized protein